MELYLDESGNTGCITTKKNDYFNFKEQRHFVLCGIKIQDEKDKKELKEKYKNFKEIFGIEDEIKGSDLMTRDYNKELEYFLDNILDNIHFEVCIYDKKFYIATLLMLTIIDNSIKCKFPVEYYQLAGILVFHAEDLLVEYCKLAEKPNSESFERFLKSIIDHRYSGIPDEENLLIICAKYILDEGDYELYLSNILQHGSYENNKYINVINLNCLTELILQVKKDYGLVNEKLNIFHDKIDGYDQTFISELKPFDIKINFTDSKEEELIQMADNVVSIIAKCINECIKRFENKKEWKEDSAWIMEQYAKVIDKLTMQNIKFTLPVQNWAVSLCIRDMFKCGYPVNQRKNIYFNEYYANYMSLIYEDIYNQNFNIHEHLTLLKK